MTLANKPNQKIVIFGLFLTILSLFNSCVSLVNTVGINRVANKQIVGVQLQNGEAIALQKVDENYRDPVVIQEFIKNWHKLALNWSSDDLQVDVEGSRIPANVYAATLALSRKYDFSTKYAQQFSELIKIAKNKSNSAVNSSVDIRFISKKEDIQQIKDNQWKVNVVAEWIISDADNQAQIETLPFNHTFTVVASPISFQTKGFQDELKGIQPIVNTIKQHGLTVIDIEEYL